VICNQSINQQLIVTGTTEKEQLVNNEPYYDKHASL